jgi:hypothetical protein
LRDLGLHRNDESDPHPRGEDARTVRSYTLDN